MKMLNYYRILGIKPDCDIEQVKAAYRKLAKTAHPDKGGDSSLFNDIKAAYETLSDSGKRAEYDSNLNRQPFKGNPYRSVTIKPKAVPVDVFDDIVEVVRRKIDMPPKVKLNAEVIVSPEEAKQGVNIEIAVPSEIICHKCFGFGGTILSDCPHCKGKGKIKITRRAYLSIEPGAKHDEKFVVGQDDIEISGRIKIER